MGFNGQDEVSDYISTQTKTTKVTFVKERGTKQNDMYIREKETKKREGTKPLLQHSCRSLNEGSQGMFLPSKIAPILEGPSKQANTHKQKLKRYERETLVCFYYKKKVHKFDDCWHSNKNITPSSPCNRNTFSIIAN